MLNRRAMLSRSAVGATAAVITPAAVVGASAAPAQAAPAAPAPAVPAPAEGIAPAPDPRGVRLSADSPRAAVEALQHLLSAAGHEAAADGSYGPRTAGAVTAFQRSHGLAADGRLGPLTAGALLADPALHVHENTPEGPVLHAVRALIRLTSGSAATADEPRISEDEIAWLRWFAARHSISPQGILVGPVMWSHLFSPPEQASGWSLAERSRDQPFRHLPLSGGRVALDQLAQAQVRNGRLVIALGKKHGIPAAGIQAAIAAIMVETWMYNRYAITDHDSSGLFQQRPSWHWGTYPQIRDAVLATEAFYGVAAHSANPGVRQYGVEGRSVGELAQAIQNSAFPERYEDRAEDAAAFYGRHAEQVAAFGG